MKNRPSRFGWTAGLSALALIGVSAWAGSLEPPGPPAPTMKTLDEIPPAWSRILPAAERFVLVMGDAAVLDKETGLVWQRQPWDDPLYVETWAAASRGCMKLELGGRLGWRLPTVEELLSLVDLVGDGQQRLPGGHPFTGINPTVGYWTATTAGSGLKEVVTLDFVSGLTCAPIPCSGVRWNATQAADEGSTHETWCVRGGHGHDRQ